MTNSSRKKLLLACVALMPAMAWAQNPPPSNVPAQAPRPVAPPPPAAAQRDWQRAVDRSAVESRQRQDALQSQLRQDSMNRQLNGTTDPNQRNQLNNANQAQQQLDRARQEDRARQYQEQHPNQPPPATTR